MKRRNKHTIILAVTATGISSVVTQVITIRELLVQFSGNEFVIALILFAWLVLNGLGSLISKLVCSYAGKISVNGLGWLLLCLAFLPSIQIFSIRFFRDVFFIPGSCVGFYPTLIFVFFSIAPYCVILGFILPYSFFVIRIFDHDFSGTKIYIADNLGDICGGVLVSFVLVYLVTPLQALFIINLPLLLTTYLIFSISYKNHFFILTLICFAFVILLSGIFLEVYSLSPHKGKLVYYKESCFGRIEIHKDNDQITMFKDGIPELTSNNQSLAEELVHYSVSQVAKPKKILLIGAEAQIITQLQKYRPDVIDYVEIDSEAISAMLLFGIIKKIPALNIICQDGRAYLLKSKKKYDAIIVNLPEPATFQTNRFYTRQFYKLAKFHLTTDGVLGFSMDGYDNYLSKVHQMKISSVYNTVSQFFNNVLLLPGQKIYFICSDNPIKKDIPACLEKKSILTSYIKYYYHGNITEERITELNSLIEKKAIQNSDTSPYLIRVVFLQWFVKFSSSPLFFSIVLVGLSIIYLFCISAKEYLLFSTGFMTMGAEILVIFAFQIFFGYIYFQIGIIITVFLVGMLPGALLGEHLVRLNNKKHFLYATDTFLIFFMGFFSISLWKWPDVLPIAFFLIFGFSVSFICGFQFPVIFRFNENSNKALSSFISADLIGAAIGALFTSVILIPYLGIIKAAIALMCLKLTSLFVMATVIKNEKN